MPRITSIFRKHLDLQLRVGGLRIRIVERPALCLEACDLRQLVNDLRRIATASVPAGELHYGIFDPDDDGLRRCVVTLIHDAQGNPIAFNALALLDVMVRGERETVVHLGLVLVDPGSRSQGLSWILYGLTCIVLFIRNQLRPLWISNVTQVPAIVGMVCETFANAYPTPDPAAKRTFTQLQIAREIMAFHRHAFGVGPEAHFNETTQVIENSYTGGSDALKKTFAQVAKHRREIFNQMCAKELNYDRGDDFLQIAQINVQTIVNYLIKDVPRRRIIRVLGLFSGTLLTALLIPALHWFFSDRPWGILRARGRTRP
ncbi:MAG: hypothetical protein LBE59_00980 [Nevskiaceae bacterium]|nr:hypothetical protein [Nevskiaceae bacterium]